jgi:hypothetical protein
MSILALNSDTLVGSPVAGQVEYNGQFYVTDSNAARGQVQRITQGTAVASTSGTSIDFTSIPSWVKRITVMFNGVSTNGTSLIQVQVGSGSFVTTGYVSAAVNIPNAATPVAANSATGMVIMGANAATIILSGVFTLTNISGNNWVYSSVCGRSDAAIPLIGGGNTPAISGTLDRVRITTVNGTDTFDAGSINILYEG